jgi:hypothetical protein
LAQTSAMPVAIVPVPSTPIVVHPAMVDSSGAGRAPSSSTTWDEPGASYV